MQGCQIGRIHIKTSIRILLTRQNFKEATFNQFMQFSVANQKNYIDASIKNIEIEVTHIVK